MRVEPERLPRLSRLMDLYGALLNARRLEVLRLYYDEDFSLAEAAEHLAVSRQAVHDHLRQGRLQLEAFEEALGLLAMEEQRALAVRRLEGELEAWAGKKLPEGLRRSLRRLAGEDEDPDADPAP